MRYREYMKLKYLAIARYLGSLLLGVALYLLVPLFVLFAYPNEAEYISSFVAASAGIAALGLFLRVIGRKASEVELGLSEGGVIVLLGWTLAIIFSAIPLSLHGPLSFTLALFESVSGWTTTGLSVVDVASAPKILLMWRSLMQLAGGAGLVIVMLSAIVGPPGRGVSQAEGRAEQLMPNVRHSANLVVRIYLGYAALGTLLYVGAGMTVFDALNHSFCSLSTGGFSTRVESIGYYNSVSIEIITMFLMIIGQINFALHYILLRGKVRAFFKNGEIRLLGGLLVVSIPLVLFLTTWALYPGGRSIRAAFFEVVSALTTTGYSSVTYEKWSDFGIGVLIVLMLIGGGINSTAGGIKQFRIFLLFKSIVWDVISNLMPSTAVHDRYVWKGESKLYVESQHFREAGNYLFIYLCTYSIGVLVFLVYGYTFRESLFEFASALGTVGLSIGPTRPDAPLVILWTEMAGMFFGRLEFFVIIFAFIKIVRDIVSVR